MFLSQISATWWLLAAKNTHFTILHQDSSGQYWRSHLITPHDETAFRYIVFVSALSVNPTCLMGMERPLPRSPLQSALLLFESLPLRPWTDKDKQCIRGQNGVGLKNNNNLELMKYERFPYELLCISPESHRKYLETWMEFVLTAKVVT